MCLLDSGRNCVCIRVLVCCVCVYARVLRVYMCVCECTRVCGVCCIAIDVHRLAEHYLLCDFKRARGHARRVPHVSSRVARTLGAALFFLVSAKKRNFFTLRRNEARIRAARVLVTRARTHTRPLALLSVCRLVRNQGLAIKNKRNCFLVPKMNPEERR